MITVEDLLQAYAYAYDAWLDPEAERKNPIPEHAEFIRRSVSWENAKLRELVRDYERCTMHADCAGCEYDGKLSTHCPFSPCFPDTDELRELGVEVD